MFRLNVLMSAVMVNSLYPVVPTFLTRCNKLILLIYQRIVERNPVSKIHLSLDPVTLDPIDRIMLLELVSLMNFLIQISASDRSHIECVQCIVPKLLD